MDDSPLGLLPGELRNEIYKLVSSVPEIHVLARTTIRSDAPIGAAPQQPGFSQTLTQEIEWPPQAELTRYTTKATVSGPYALFMTCKQIYAESELFRSHALEDCTLYFHLEVAPSSHRSRPADMPKDHYAKSQSAVRYGHDAALSEVLKNGALNALRNTASYPRSVIIDFGICCIDQDKESGVLYEASLLQTVQAVASLFSQRPQICFLNFRIIWPNASEKYRLFELLVPCFDDNAAWNSIDTTLDAIRQEIRDTVGPGVVIRGENSATFAHICTTRWHLRSTTRAITRALGV